MAELPNPNVYSKNGILQIDIPLCLNNLKQGATQAESGAVKGEIWITSGHALAPDNTLMIGV